MVSCPARIKIAIKLFISASNFLLPRELVTVMAMTLTFCSHRNTDNVRRDKQTDRQRDADLI